MNLMERTKLVCTGKVALYVAWNPQRAESKRRREMQILCWWDFDCRKLNPSAIAVHCPSSTLLALPPHFLLIFIDSVVMALGFSFAAFSLVLHSPRPRPLFQCLALFSVAFLFPSLPLASFWTALPHCSCRVLSLSASTSSLLSFPLASQIITILLKITTVPDAGCLFVKIPPSSPSLCQRCHSFVVLFHRLMPSVSDSIKQALSSIATVWSQLFSIVITLLYSTQCSLLN